MPKLGAAPGATDTLVASAARTTSGDSGMSTGWGVPSVARVQLDVTAVADATATLDVVVEDTLDDVNWNVVGTFAQKAAVGRDVINLATPFTDRLRVRWTIGGGTTPSFTFSVMAYSE
jgi:hypothetical protein